MRGLAFFRRLPRWARRLWYAVLLVTAVELALLIAALIWAPGWIWLASEVFSFSAWPLGAGLAVVELALEHQGTGRELATAVQEDLAVVVLVGSYTSRRRRPAAAAVTAAPPSSREPSAGEPAARPASQPAEGIEIAAARSAARLLAQAARRPEGQAAMRRTGRLARAVRAAARPPEGEGGGERPGS